MNEFGQCARILPILCIAAYYFPQAFFGEEVGKLIFFCILSVIIIAAVAFLLVEAFGDALFSCLFFVLVAAVVIALAFALITWIISNFWTIVWSFVLMIATIFVWFVILACSDALDSNYSPVFGWILKILGVIATIFVVIKLFRYAVIGFILFLIIGCFFEPY